MPKQVVADSHYGSDEDVQAAAQEGVELVAPVSNTEKSGPLPLAAFAINEQGVVTGCPGGQVPVRVRVVEKGVTVWFDPGGCERCAQQERCPVIRSRKKVRLRYDKVAMRSSRRRQAEAGEEFREKYRMRSGIESSFSQLDRRTGVKHLRVRGIKAVRFCVFLKALGLNILRFAAWLAGGGVALVPGPKKDGLRPQTDLQKAFFSRLLSEGWSFRSFFGWMRSAISFAWAQVTVSPSGMPCSPFFIK
jgi:hypothetical protein